MYVGNQTQGMLFSVWILHVDNYGGNQSWAKDEIKRTCLSPHQSDIATPGTDCVRIHDWSNPDASVSITAQKRHSHFDTSILDTFRIHSQRNFLMRLRRSDIATLAADYIRSSDISILGILGAQCRSNTATLSTDYPQSNPAVPNDVRSKMLISLTQIVPHAHSPSLLPWLQITSCIPLVCSYI